jgi:hypothetical protein
MTCRDEVVAVAKWIVSTSGINGFSIEDIVTEMGKRKSSYPESTIRTHIISRLCANAPNHAVRYPDFLRIARGRYALSGAAL